MYEYCRSGATFLDNQFFIRQHTNNNPHLPADLHNFGMDNDQQFTTGCDFLVAKVSANYLYRKFIEEELAKLNNPTPQLTDGVIGKAVWTASKAALLELLYALQSSGVFNYGRGTLNEVALFIEQVFGIKLSNYYWVFQRIRIRKKSQTQFLDEVKDQLVQKMDYWDENPNVG